jgi:serine/threonine protein phosphatase PrpC
MKPESGGSQIPRDVLSTPLDVRDFKPLSSVVRVEIGSKSDAGRIRQTNEDHYLVLHLARQQETLATSLPQAELPRQFDEHGYVMLVADGLGDSGAGAVASRVALGTLAHLAIHYGRWNVRVDPDTATEIKERAEWFYRQADSAVVTRSHTNPALKGMATTLTAAYSAGDDLFIAHVGHSRAYLFREGSLTQLTRDHTVQSHMSDIGTPTGVARGAQDLRHILTDTIGGDAEGSLVDVQHLRLQNGDCVLLCTNGLTDMVSTDAIAGVLAFRRSSDEQCRLLVDLARRRGGRDNVTVLLAQYQIPRS